MSIEIRNRYDDSYPDRLQIGHQKKSEEVKEAVKSEEAVKNIPIPEDEYISSEKSGGKPVGLYRMGQDDKGNPKIIYDDPKKIKKNVQSADPKSSTEKTTTNTDRVDSEIKRLKEEKKQLEQQLKAASGNEEKIKELEQKLTQIENELSQKDNDTYRRQNADIS